MVILILEKVPPALRGDLTRWLMEVNTGVFIGHVSAMVRDRLWARASENRGAGSVFQAWSTNNEQRFKMRIAGESEREVVDWEGVELIRDRRRNRKNDKNASSFFVNEEYSPHAWG